MRKLFLCALLFLTQMVSASDYPLDPTRYLDFNGLDIAVYESEGTKGPGVLLIHGNTSGANSYQRFFETRYAKKHRMVAIDLPGYGLSDNASFYNAGFLVDAITFAAQQLDAKILAGWSLGGDLAIQASTGLPNLKGVFTFGTAPIGFTPELPPPFLTPEESFAGQAVNYGFIPNLTNVQLDEYVIAFFRPRFNDIPGYMFEDARLTDPLTRQAVGAAAAGLDPTFLDEVVISKNLSIPLALVVGTGDFFVRIEYLQALENDLPTLFTGHTIVLPVTGHAIHVERPRLFSILLRSFVLTSILQ